METQTVTARSLLLRQPRGTCVSGEGRVLTNEPCHSVIFKTLEVAIFQCYKQQMVEKWNKSGS